MSKFHLRRLLSGSEIPKILVVYDHWNVCGRNLTWSLVKSHLNVQRCVHYLCYSINPNVLSYFSKDENKVTSYDLFSDPLQWNNNSDSSLCPSRSFDDLLNLKQLNTDSDLVIVIDQINEAAKYVNETQLLHNLQVLKKATSVSQVIVNCNVDVSSSSLLASLDFVCSSSIRLKPSNPLSCDVLIKKKSGKILKSCEEFQMNKNFELEFSRERASGSKTELEEPSESTDLAFQTTFKLSLTSEQKEAKNRLVLPHTRIQESGGQIHYIPDEADDWDDEDPDDDLEI